MKNPRVKTYVLRWTITGAVLGAAYWLLLETLGFSVISVYNYLEGREAQLLAQFTVVGILAGALIGFMHAMAANWWKSLGGHNKKGASRS